MNRSLPLLLAIGDVAARHIEELETVAKHHRNKTLVRIIAIAACLAVIIVGIYTIAFQSDNIVTLVPENTPQSFVSTQMPSPENISIEELINRAEVIVAAKVVTEYRELCGNEWKLYLTDSVTADHNTENVAASYHLTVDVRVQEVLKGDVAVDDILHLSNNALEDYDEHDKYISTFYWSDTALMQKGDRVLLFLYKPFAKDDPYYRLVGEAGKWFQNTDNKYYCGLLDDERFPENYEPCVGLEEYHSYTQEELKEKID